tara:strand:+ start:426 stop:779 length:354 start_codon:yes stop_codon:yes gene_type:complete
MAKYKKDHTYNVQQSGNLALGQAGSVFVTGTAAISALAASTSGVFVAIQFIEDTVFADADGLVAETTELFPDDTGTCALVSANGDDTDGETFPQGMTIFGRWTGFKLASGKVIAYLG